MNKLSLCVFTFIGLTLASCSKGEKKDVENIHTELKALRRHVKEDIKGQSKKALELTQETKGEIQDKKASLQEFTAERWHTFVHQLNTWKERLAGTNRKKLKELNEEFRLLHSEIDTLKQHLHHEREEQTHYDEHPETPKSESDQETISKALEMIDARIQRIKETFDK